MRLRFGARWARCRRADEIEFAQADLLDDAGWSEAVAGCDFVLHVASPFIMGEPKDPNDLIKPAVEDSTCSRRRSASIRRVC